MTDHKILYLSQADIVSTGLSMAEIIQLLEKAFEEKGHGRVEMPPKPGIRILNLVKSLIDLISF